MEKFQLTLFGGFQLADATGKMLTPATRKARALLAWLALTSDREHPREKIAALFWPDSDESQARHSLRQTLVELHRLIPEDYAALRATRDWISLDSQLINIDAQVFNTALAQGDEHSLDKALELYQGELLEGCNPRSDMFSAWLETYRNDYSLRAVATLRQRLNMLLEQQDYPRSLHYATQLIALDPLQESAYRALMQAHHGLGDPAAAHRWYQHCRNVLQQELGVAPSPETEALFEKIAASQASPTTKTDSRIPQQCGCASPKIRPDSNERILCLVKNALNGIVCNRLGHSFLIRGGNAHTKHKLVESILTVAQEHGFNCQRSAIPPSGSGDLIPAGCPNTTQPCLFVVEHIHLAKMATLKALAALISAAGGGGALLVMTSRLEGEPLDPAWRGAMRGAPLTTIDL